MTATAGRPGLADRVQPLERMRLHRFEVAADLASRKLAIEICPRKVSGYPRRFGVVDESFLKHIAWDSYKATIALELGNDLSDWESLLILYNAVDAFHMHPVIRDGEPLDEASRAVFLLVARDAPRMAKKLGLTERALGYAADDPLLTGPHRAETRFRSEIRSPHRRSARTPRANGLGRGQISRPRRTADPESEALVEPVGDQPGRDEADYEPAAEVRPQYSSNYGFGAIVSPCDGTTAGPSARCGSGQEA